MAIAKENAEHQRLSRLSDIHSEMDESEFIDVSFVDSKGIDGDMNVMNYF